jgi:hypothetical protein
VTARQRPLAKQDLVLDTNILLLLIGYQWALNQKLDVSDRTDQLEELRGRDPRLPPELFERLWNRFKSNGKRLITQHVVAETWSLGKARQACGKADSLWSGMLEVLSHPGIEEASLEVRAMYERPEYQKIADTVGPTDAGLIYLAERRSATILTEDGELLHWAHTRSVRTLQLSQIGSAL